MLVDLNILIREVQECYIHGLFRCGKWEVDLLRLVFWSCISNYYSALFKSPMPENPANVMALWDFL